MIYVVYAVKENEKDYMEDFITETSDKNYAEYAKTEILKHGFRKARIMTVNGNEKPDFIGSIRF